MRSLENTAVIIPCLNEAAAISRIVSGVWKQVARVIVVDDGSSDETSSLAKDAGAEVLRHPTPSGKGKALETGLRHAIGQGCAWAITMDGDGQHDPADVASFLAVSPDVALVIGNRMGDCQKMPWLRRQVNRWMSRRISRLAGMELPDTQCGFRRVNLDAWQKLQLKGSHFEAESELVMRFVAAAHRVQFVPVRVIYKDECSKIHPWTDTVRWFRWYFRVKKEFPTRSRPSVGPVHPSRAVLNRN